MNEVRAARSPTGGAGEAAQHQWQRERELRPPAQVPGHSRPVGNAEVADPLHLIGDEQAGSVTRPARVRGRQDRDLQRGAIRRPKTTGVASASRARA
jgi:hypothetical protein